MKKQYISFLCIAIVVGSLCSCSSDNSVSVNDFQLEVYDISDDIRAVLPSDDGSKISLYVYSDELDFDYEDLSDRVAVIATNYNLSENNEFSIVIYDISEYISCKNSDIAYSGEFCKGYS